MARRIVAEFDAVTGPFLRKMNQIDGSLVRMERGVTTSLGRIESSMNRTGRVARNFHATTALIGAGFGANIAAGFLDEAKLIRNALREAGDASQETFEAVFQSSVRALSGFKEVAQGVQRFQKAVGDRQTIDDSIRQLETLNKMLALSGKTAQERASTMIQFSQALQAGYLGGEELRAVRENAPIELTRAIAEQAGGTIQDLKDLGAQGKLTTEVMIAALESLAEEADRRFNEIQVTIGDSAKVLRSGAVIAVEGFDEGLGISRAAVSTLTTLGKVLGESADAARVFGEAVKVAGAAFIASLAGRRIQGAITGLRAMSAARMQHVNALAAEVVQLDRQVVQQRRAVEAAQRHQASVVAAGRAQSTQAKAADRVNRANERLNATTRRYTATVNALNAAQARLAFSTRAVAAAGAFMRGAWAFLGGWWGLILAAGTAMFALSQRAKAAAAAHRELETYDGSAVTSAIDSVIDAETRLRDLIEDRADMTDTATDRIIAATRREFEAKKGLLEQSMLTLQGDQAERVRRRISLQSELDSLPTPVERLRTDLAGLSTQEQMNFDAEARSAQLIVYQREYDAAARLLRREIDALDSAIDEAKQDIQDARRLLAHDFSGPGEYGPDGAPSGAPSDDTFDPYSSEQRTEFLADYNREAARLNELLEARKRALAGIEAATKADNATVLAEFRVALSEINDEIETLLGEGGDINEMLLGLVDEAEDLRDMLDQVGLDEDGRVNEQAKVMRTNVAQAIEQIERAIENVEDLDGTGLTRLISQVESLKGAFGTLLDLMGRTRDEFEDGIDMTPWGMPQSSFDTTGMDRGAMAALAALERAAGQTFTINSAYRDPAHNAAVGGASKSQHTHGRAFDIDASDMSTEERVELIKLARQVGFGGIGVYANALHFDTGPTRAWGPDYSSKSVPGWAAEAVGFGRGPVPGGLSGSPRPRGRGQGEPIDLRAEAREVAKEREDAERERLDAIAEDEQSALAFIESVMRAEERQAKQLQELLDLRERLVATHGEEADIVQRLDIAIGRMRSEMEVFSEETRQFFEMMSEEISNSITDWQGWGNMIRSILASLVRQYGPAFFTALLTPGGQTGTNFGTRLANAITGFGFDAIPGAELHTGGVAGVHGRARMVPAQAFANAQRFHNGRFPGLASDEVAAILQRGEVVLPRGTALSGAQSAGRQVADVRVFMDKSGNLQAYVERVAVETSAPMIGSAMRQQDRVFGKRAAEFGARGR